MAQTDTAFVVDGKPIDALRVVDLKEQLRQRKLPCTGVKETLKARLIQALQEERSATQQVVDAGSSQPVTSSSGGDVGQRLNAADTSADTERPSTGGDVEGLSEKPKNEVDKPESSDSSKIGQSGNSTTKPGGKRQIRALSEAEREVAEMELDFSDKEDGISSAESRGVGGGGKVGDGGEEVVSSAGKVGSSNLPSRADSTGSILQKKESRKRKIVIRSQSKDSELAGESAKKKRTWSSNTDNKPSSSIPISTDSLKEIIPADISSQEKAIDTDEDDSDSRAQRFSERPERRPRLPVVPPKPESSANARLSALAIIDAIANANTQAEQRLPSSPAHNSNIVHVTNLVRPFTVPQIKELLSNKAAIKDFWMDRIKSHCYVTYASEADAEASREYLDKLKWPGTSPKYLSVDYATVEELNKAKGIVTGKKLVEVSSEGDGQPPSDEKTAGEKSGAVEAMDQEEPKEEAAKVDVPTAAKLLDDLFRKTKTQPSLYWLPLTAQEAAEKMKRQKVEAEQRRQRELEKEKGPQRRGRESDRRHRRSKSRSFERTRRR
eukprot:m.177173 g.177173  ORF g.177173 m.177173 type:complete len:551 (+) comp39157_c0_seq5:163-1815(+)